MTPHVRRKRYSGTHPKRFDEKYKEANPEKYADTVEKVIRKGGTPAGMHLSIMVNEIMDVLKIVPGEIGLDATLGYGGHTRAMLDRLDGKGHLYSLDVDPIEILKTEERLRKAGYGDDILTIIKTNFANIDDVASTVGRFDFCLADLGVSSMQIDNPARGFSYKTDAPLDLRLDPEHGESAAQRLNSISEDEFIGMMIDNSDEPYAEEIARVVFEKKRKGTPIHTTGELRQAIIEALRCVPDTERREAVKKSCARVFQALRIDVNSELEVLYTFLEKLPSVLNPGARVAILTFHSGEDRLVKKMFKQLKKEGVFCEISEEVIRPGKEECIRNPRAKSTKLRYAIKAQ
ncbi:MAG: 16S rRNA (cytosine(1402)-N(4))-methyltransferase RsmH [Lachnospiraceae bacterium]|nr:16S rRNA (cytosine(1402)-N(4))-methyltransferase RsmH [Lachnospiraceae bacterium]